MSTQTVILVAIGVALIIVGAVYGLGSTAIKLGDTTIGNLSDRADSENGDPSFSPSSLDKESFKFSKPDKGATATL
jgi:hypothetical protein